MFPSSLIIANSEQTVVGPLVFIDAKKDAVCLTGATTMVVACLTARQWPRQGLLRDIYPRRRLPAVIQWRPDHRQHFVSCFLFLFSFFCGGRKGNASCTKGCFLFYHVLSTCVGSMLVVVATVWLIKAAVCRRPLRCFRRGSCYWHTSHLSLAYITPAGLATCPSHTLHSLFAYIARIYVY